MLRIHTKNIKRHAQRPLHREAAAAMFTVLCGYHTTSVCAHMIRNCGITFFATPIWVHINNTTTLYIHETANNQQTEKPKSMSADGFLDTRSLACIA